MRKSSPKKPTVEQRLRAIEDREQIRELAATYCFLVDDGRFDELVETCFTEDASCDFRGTRSAMGPMVSKGRAEVTNFFAVVVPGLLRDMAHTVHNHRVRILDDNHASGECYFELTAIENATGEAVVGAGRYIDRYRREAGSWRFEVRNAEIFFITSIRESWATKRFINVLTTPSR